LRRLIIQALRESRLALCDGGFFLTFAPRVGTIAP
jgi:hypothetical protein